MLKRVIALFFAVVMLASNAGFALNTHYCGGEAVESSLSIGIAHLDCGMTETKKDCESGASHTNQIDRKPCCENEHQSFQLEDDFELQSDSNPIHPVFIIAFVDSFVQTIIDVPSIEIFSANFSPPLPKQDKQVLFQSFLL
jgi:hypothetical protein